MMENLKAPDLEKHWGQKFELREVPLMDYHEVMVM